jgi:hypothetical protein
VTHELLTAGESRYRVVIAAEVPVLVEGTVLVAVTVQAVPTVAAVVNAIVATPAALVVAGLAPENAPPVPVLVNVTARPGVATALPYWSASCAVIVTAWPARGL